MAAALLQYQACLGIMVRLQVEDLTLLKEDFDRAGRGLSLREFVNVMLDRVSWEPETVVSFIEDLIELFAQVDVNGDGTMEWEEFTSAIIEGGMGSSGGGNDDAAGSVAQLRDLQYEEHPRFVDAALAPQENTTTESSPDEEQPEENDAVDHTRRLFDQLQGKTTWKKSDLQLARQVAWEKERGKFQQRMKTIMRQKAAKRKKEEQISTDGNQHEDKVSGHGDVSESLGKLEVLGAGDADDPHMILPTLQNPVQELPFADKDNWAVGSLNREKQISAGAVRSPTKLQSPKKELKSAKKVRIRSDAALMRQERFGPYSRDDIVNIYRTFRKLDQDGSGAITIREILGGSGLFSGTHMQDNIGSIFSSIDKDQSGLIDLAELCTVVFGDAPPEVLEEILRLCRLLETVEKNRRVRKKTLTAEQVQELQQLFKLYDKDDNGDIDASELFEALQYNDRFYESDRRGSTQLTKEDVARIISTFDVNANATLDLEEFIELFREDA
ncbi:hypothetical protein JG687_00012488 [Phytophthora cactorum]|uniref:EF-hand domain-containing protein n=1 Tax=Phytophthora cactorum TaxID=29920 RepID=A0A8T1U4A0_9STRA|nr:hypothetical protein JG687_00012488 [Phytophthora cactorum]